MKCATILLVVLLSRAACATDLVDGTAFVIDGDAIEINDERIRLHGIDSPELAQRCTEDGAQYPCGLDASHALRKRIGRKSVSGVRRDTDRYGGASGIVRATVYKYIRETKTDGRNKQTEKRTVSVNGRDHSASVRTLH